MSRFAGVIPPLCTPLDVDGRVDVGSLESLITFQLEAGVQGLFVLGSSGEAIYLTDDDRRKIVDVTTSYVAGQVPVFAGALDASTRRVIDQVRWLSDLAIQALVITAPFYANLSDPEIVGHFTAIAARTELPLIAYDIPGNVGRKLPLRVAQELLESGTISGIKDSSGSLADFRRLLDKQGEDRRSSLLSGADILADIALEIGADGLIPGLANVRPDLFVDLYAAHLRGDKNDVASCQHAILDLVAIFSAGEPFGLGRHASELGGLKYILQREGIIATAVVSPPLTRYPDEGLRALDEIVDRIPR
jgi:4-hydroxy-tetrahydrodipicolinate synthase